MKLQPMVLVCGAGGFIGNHLVTSLKSHGFYVIGADLKYPEFSESDADEFYICDLSDWNQVDKVVTENIQTIYQLAADMGGAGYVFTGDNDADILTNSLAININICKAMLKNNIKNVFFTSSACVYPEELQTNVDYPVLVEEKAYPANPDSEYGWEKLTSERLYLSYARNYNLRVRIARLHNVFGSLTSYNNGKEKAPAALCRKIIENSNAIQIWGDGQQQRSFLYIDECIKGIHKIQNSNYNRPLNLGAERIISINRLVKIICDIAGKQIKIEHIPGPLGVQTRTSDNKKIREILNWAPAENLEYGLTQTYNWIKNEINR